MAPKVITLLCNTFPPERGAAATRLWQMAKLLAHSGYDVRVITVMPNYPTGKIFEGYRNKVFHKEVMEGIMVYRIPIIPSNSSSLLRRAFSMGSHILSLLTSGLWRLLMARSQVVIINTPSIVNGFTGSLMAHLITKAKVVLNVSDLYPDTALALGAITNGSRYRWLKKLEHRMYQRADAFLTQSEEIWQHISSIITEPKPAMVYRNLKVAPTVIISNSSTQKTLLYAGLLGVAQGVLRICQEINFADAGVALHIYGDGAERKALEQFLQEQPNRGIYYHGSAPEAAMPDILAKHQALLVPLVAPIKGAVPSKIFMGMAYGLPILFMGSGEPAAIVAEHKLGWVVPPQDFVALKDAVLQLANITADDYRAMQYNAGYATRTFFNKKQQDEQLLQFIDKLISS